MDARVVRTKVHVIAVAREMLASAERLTYSSLSRNAGVSRQTLYVHWNTIDDLIAAAAQQSEEDVQRSISEREEDAEERVFSYLVGVRERIAQPENSAALATLIYRAGTDTSARESLLAMNELRIDELRGLLGPITGEQYLMLVSPLFMAEFLMRKPATDDLLRGIARSTASAYRPESIAAAPRSTGASPIPSMPGVDAGG